MDEQFKKIKTSIFDKCTLEVDNYKQEEESKDYSACQFELDGNTIVSRNSKITPKKTGQFVTFWKRNGEGPIEPFAEADDFHFYTVNVSTKNRLGQFVFPKSILIKKGIVSTQNKEGKRGFRVYPSWDHASSLQAQKTQKWQLDYFFEINENTDLELVKTLYKAK